MAEIGFDFSSIDAIINTIFGWVEIPFDMMAGGTSEGATMFLITIGMIGFVVIMIISAMWKERGSR